MNVYAIFRVSLKTMYFFQEMAIIFNSYSTLSILEKCLRYSRDGTNSQFFNLSLSSFNYFPSFFYLFHLWYSEDGANFTIFILSLSFFSRLLSLSYIYTGPNLLIKNFKSLFDPILVHYKSMRASNLYFYFCTSISHI